MEIHHNLIDFKKALDRVWRKALWLVMRKHHHAGALLVKVIESLYEGNSIAVLTSSRVALVSGSRQLLKCLKDSFSLCGYLKFF